MTDVHTIVGEERIERICKAHKLNSEDRKVLDEILERWEGLVGNLPEKMKVAAELLGKHSKRGEITSALLQVICAFVQGQKR